MSEGPIPGSKIKEYLIEEEWPPEMQGFMYMAIRTADNMYMDYQAQEIEKANKSSSIKQNKREKLGQGKRLRR